MMDWGAPFSHIFCQKFQVGIPFVPNDFTAGEAAHWNNLHSKNISKWLVTETIERTMMKVQANKSRADLGQ